MNLFFVSAAICLICFGHCIRLDKLKLTTAIKPDEIDDYLMKATKEEEEREDQHALDEAIQQFGPAQDYKKFDLPGPELTKYIAELSNITLINNDGSGNYSFSILVVADRFAYKSRYEVGELKKDNDGKEIMVVKGQYAEKFKRKSGGFYIRTIGYIADENGYRPFLIDISTAKPKFEVIPAISYLFGAHPEVPKILISSTVLGTLIGGNIG